MRKKSLALKDLLLPVVPLDISKLTLGEIVIQIPNIHCCKFAKFTPGMRYVAHSNTNRYC